ncbi:uncharacterized protein LOC125954840 [Anopheles darlingi]|uniref:uncharacterized protein LOC125954840 n=1 Tax=Anopheles darlingi TaxID=43151 RepID=UPI0021002E04|nr:uncharacterized protein LOC125954840 [Anopheles darlingi]XP_049541432.1 uncharacterized protein LOC125954840 [Anopheles darlingi]XP_049541433.1 uncharacterized protein LOC125954840 [Anopheles darlingi]
MPGEFHEDISVSSTAKRLAKRNLSGPRRRQTLESFRKSSIDDGAVTAALLSVSNSFEAHSAETSVNKSSHQTLTDEEETSDNEVEITEDSENEQQDLVRHIRQPTLVITRRQRTPSLNGIDTIPFVAERIPTPPRPPVNDVENGNTFMSLVIVVAVLLIIVAGLFSGGSAKKKAAEPSCIHFDILESSYHSIDSTLWDSLDCSVRQATHTTARPKPGTFLFMHNGAPAVVSRFLENVTKITSDCFGGTAPIVLGSERFKQPDIASDFGVFVAEYAQALRERSVMVVRNLEDIPPKAAQAFHSICDPEEPLVSRALIYLTMDISTAPKALMESTGSSETAKAEKLLKQMWQDSLRPEVLDPLITRLTENVYRIV